MKEIAMQLSKFALGSVSNYAFSLLEVSSGREMQLLNAVAYLSLINAWVYS
jgi:hypothetical protein